MFRATVTVLVLAALIFLEMGAAIGQSTRSAGATVPSLSLAVVDSVPLPAGEVRGVTWLTNDSIAVLFRVPASFSASGPAKVLLAVQDRRGNIKRREDFSGVLSRGLAFDGEFLWSCGDDQEGGSILYQIQFNPLEILEQYPTPGHFPWGLSCDGEFLWITDRDSGRLDRFDFEEEAITRSILTPGFSPTGLAADGSFAWVADRGTGRLYRLRGARGRFDAVVQKRSFCFRGQDVVLTGDGQSLWYAPAGAKVAYRVRIR